MLADTYRALRAALDGLGLHESPRAQSAEQGWTGLHRGYQLLLTTATNTREIHDRARTAVELRITVRLTHRIRGTGEDGHTDLGDALEDAELVVGAWMGSNVVALRGRAEFDDVRFELDPTGTWHRTEVDLRIVGEFGWTLETE